MITGTLSFKLINYEDDYDVKHLIEGIRKKNPKEERNVIFFYQLVDEGDSNVPELSYDVNVDENGVYYMKLPCMKREDDTVDMDYFRFLFSRTWEDEFLGDPDILKEKIHEGKIFIIVDLSSEEFDDPVDYFSMRRMAGVVAYEMYHQQLFAGEIDPDAIEVMVISRRERKKKEKDIFDPYSLMTEDTINYYRRDRRDIRSKDKDKKKKKKNKKDKREVRKKK